jgi:hypothetical protein
MSDCLAPKCDFMSLLARFDFRASMSDKLTLGPLRAAREITAAQAPML